MKRSMYLNVHIKIMNKNAKQCSTTEWESIPYFLSINK
jgi:hypothetical protein